jgi:hypothetical protein
MAYQCVQHNKRIEIPSIDITYGALDPEANFPIGDSHSHGDESLLASLQSGKLLPDMIFTTSSFKLKIKDVHQKFEQNLVIFQQK